MIAMKNNTFNRIDFSKYMKQAMRNHTYILILGRLIASNVNRAMIALNWHIVASLIASNMKLQSDLLHSVGQPSATDRAA